MLSDYVKIKHMRIEQSKDKKSKDKNPKKISSKKKVSKKKALKNKRAKKGFTLIEGVLVLAIGGLIFMLVFIGFPSLVRMQRDTQRRTNLSMIVAAMNEWNNTHRVTVNDAFNARNDNTRGFCRFYNDYVDPEIVDPATGEPYKAGLWGSTKVIDCTTGTIYERGELDPHALGTTKGTGWPMMEVGDLQYDDTATCAGETFDDHVGRRAGLKFFAFRTKLENGGYLCLDSSSPLQIK
jgi:prepilin-type N-terminal cleavage/methylation domain-containing protein